MGRARVVAPPPQDYIPVPLEHTGHLEEPPVEEVSEAVTEDVAFSWIDGDMREEEDVLPAELDQEEIERERIAQEKYEDLLLQKANTEMQAKEDADILSKAKELLENPPVMIETVVETIHIIDPKLEAQIEKIKKEKKELTAIHKEELIGLNAEIDNLKATVPSNPNLLAQISQLTADNERLTREKDAAEKAREQQILSLRQKGSETRGNNQQLNIVKNRNPKLLDRIRTFFKTYLRNRRIKNATVGIKSYDIAIIQRARIAVPKMLDDMEKMHEQLSILEELINKHVQLDKSRGR